MLAQFKNALRIPLGQALGIMTFDLGFDSGMFHWCVLGLSRKSSWAFRGFFYDSPEALMVLCGAVGYPSGFKIEKRDYQSHGCALDVEFVRCRAFSVLRPNSKQKKNEEGKHLVKNQGCVDEKLPFYSHSPYFKSSP